MAQYEKYPVTHSSDDDDDDEKAELFPAVLTALDKEQLSLIAFAFLQHTSPLSLQSSRAKPSVSDPVFGSYHVVFPLTLRMVCARWSNPRKRH